VSELYQNGGHSLLEALNKIILSIWEKEVMPKEWNTGLSCIILKCINQYAERERVLEEYQCGFRHGRSTVEQIFIIRQLMEKCFEFNSDICILFVDYNKDVNNIDRIEFLNAMGSYGIPKKLVRCVEMTMKDSDAKNNNWWKCKQIV
jgi:hypothetical protein